MVGQALVRHLSQATNVELVLRTRQELDLTQQTAVQEFFNHTTIDEVYIAAAHVGGIYANQQYPVEFILNNLRIELNLIEAAFNAGVKKLLFLGSSCIYPKLAPQPIPESALLTGPLEPTNEPYAIAKIAGIKLCESYNRQYAHLGIDYRAVMPTNLYGPGDNYHPVNSHVLPGLLRRFHEAKLNNAAVVSVWGSGQAKREFLHVDDLARACVFIQNLTPSHLNSLILPQQSHINIGSGQEVSIRELAQLIKATVGYTGSIVFDTQKPDGTPRKLLDCRLLNSLGFTANIDLVDGLAMTYTDFCRTHLSQEHIT